MKIFGQRCGIFSVFICTMNDGIKQFDFFFFYLFSKMYICILIEHYIVNKNVIIQKALRYSDARMTQLHHMALH